MTSKLILPETTVAFAAHSLAAKTVQPPSLTGTVSRLKAELVDGI